MNKTNLLELLHTIGDSIGNKSKLFDAFQELLLAFIEEPMSTCELAVFFETKDGHQFFKRPLPTGSRPSAVELIEIANLQTVAGGGYKPLLVISHGYHHSNATSYFVRAYDGTDFFRAEWIGRAETARVSYSGTPENLRELFKVEHDTATND